MSKPRQIVTAAHACAALGASALILMAASACRRDTGTPPQHAGGAAAAGATAISVDAVSVPVEGMACVACAAKVRTSLKGLPGVRDVEVDLERRAVRIEYAPGSADLRRLTATIDELGYRSGTPTRLKSQ